MKIAHVSTAIIQDALPCDTLDPSTQTLLLLVADESGRIGVGETDAPADVVDMFLKMPTAHEWSRNFEEMLVGENAVELSYLWEKMYQGTIWAGRRGLGIHAISAVDIALHDLAGKQLGIPVYQLLGGRRRPYLTPYATIYGGSPSTLSWSVILDNLLERMARAVEIGFRAVKMELLFGNQVKDAQLVEMLQEGRRVIGDDIAMLVDFGYRFSHWRDAATLLRKTEACDLFLAEAPLPHDDLAGHARLSNHVGVRIGGAEMAATRFECQEWIEQGKVDVLQPDVNRCGGLTELRRIALMAESYGVEVIPHAWKTGITIAACRHFQACTPNCPYFEFLSPHLWISPLRDGLVYPEPVLQSDGTMALPEQPGLGIQLQENVLQCVAPSPSVSRAYRNGDTGPINPPANGSGNGHQSHRLLVTSFSSAPAEPEQSPFHVMAV